MTLSEMAEAEEILKADPTKKKQPYKLVDWVFIVLAIGMFLYQMFSTLYQVQGTTGQQNIHLMLAMVIVLLTVYRKKKVKTWLCLLLIVLALIPTLYVQFFQDYLEVTTEMGRADALQIFMGILLVAMPMVACHLAFGMSLTIVNTVCLAYLFLGQYLPIAFGHGGYSFERIIIQLSIGLSSGVYGSYLQASLSYIFLLIVFGAALETCGATSFFVEFGKWVGQKVRGGVAQTAVVSSALVGMISGSPMANAAICGVYTIPAMKSVGFRPFIAAGIEAAASTGGQIMPPVMGAAAFIMASFLGIPYATIMLIAFIPAFLYFFGIFAYIFFEAGKWKLAPWKPQIDKKEILLRAPLFFVPLGLLVYFLLSGFSVMYGAFFSIIATFILGMLRKETRPSLRSTIDGLASGVQSGCAIAITCAVLGVMAVTMTMSGLGLKIPDIVHLLSGGNLILALLLAYIAGIILGTGLHTVAVYTILALTVAPALVQMGVPILAAHFFILYNGVISNVTPPVALPALVTSGIAGAPYMKSSWYAWLIAAPGTILPFCFIWCPPLLLVFKNPVLDILALVSIAAGLFILSAGYVGCFVSKINWLERFILVLSAVGFVAFSFSYNFAYMAGALALTIFLFIWQKSRRGKAKLASQ